MWRCYAELIEGSGTSADDSCTTESTMGKSVQVVGIHLPIDRKTNQAQHMLVAMGYLLPRTQARIRRGMLCI